MKFYRACDGSFKISNEILKQNFIGGARARILAMKTRNVKFSDAEQARRNGKRELASLVAYVPQTHAPSYDYSVFDVALMGALCRTPLFSSFSAANKKLTEQALEKNGHRASKKRALHKGQRRRARLYPRASIHSDKQFAPAYTNKTSFFGSGDGLHSSQ